MKSMHQKRINSGFLTNPPTPGVGTYNVRKSTDFTLTSIPAIRIGTSQRQSLENVKVRDFPGPANYKLDDINMRWIKNHSPRAFIGTSTRKDLNKTINWPGPAHYEVHNNLG